MYYAIKTRDLLMVDLQAHHQVQAECSNVRSDVERKACNSEGG